MMRILLVCVPVLLAVASVVAASFGSLWWIVSAVVFAVIAAIGIYDLVQKRHSVLRNYPILGHLRYLLELVRPELQQYFIERNFDGRPFDRDKRSLIYERAKGTAAELSFGTERDIDAAGYEHLVHSTAPVEVPDTPPRVRIGGPDCRHPYEMALLNVSAMSFGALSANALKALNAGAERGGFAHDTGEGGLTPYHLGGSDVVWEIGSGYFGCRTEDGRFDPAEFARKAADDRVKCLSLKLSQGAKPGIGGVLPAAKVSAEIAEYRGVPQGEKCISPAAHREFSTPRGLIRFIGRMRRLADGKPVGFKLCVGSRVDVLAICKAILEEGIAPDFIIVDGAEGGTAAAPLEYEDHVGLPLTDGLMTLHNALVGCGLRQQIRVGASGKVATGADIVKRLIQGADYTNSARAMMMAVGCIQSQRCHTNKCPVGVATQDPRRARALDVEDKSTRVFRYQQATVAQAMKIMASMGVSGPSGLTPYMLRKRIGPISQQSYAEIYEWLAPAVLLNDPPASWAADWEIADPDSFTPAPWHQSARG
ncbi:FMN-binding glutamate synthase family protein [Rhodococcus sp. PAMC28707]|uniref:FMN-binding glutamate synthase family protein n=1 Tax=unclassified Rhodococcus (in: high G+C Gram-positive bacteria) TaxID=192944 RepID=UPI00109DC7D3|nr:MULTISPECIES: FMN-binding glutamate synthase family protein [unclassified Rhodococcus (in: high G+C Gram-positive bacteria)]QCB49529.1 FMN-binding glutamate synthase family protein [Rhodococcus sp. PAMC28705]QCB58781.1 FMN-binding glutamate synthase family protein [Rhodococcus sp. PAMC28707]